MVYLYSWNSREGKIFEYKGYIFYGRLYEQPNNSGSWICHTPTKEGEYWDNKVWFRKPNKQRAILIFIAHENEMINKLRDEIAKRNEKIRVLANMEVEDGINHVQRKAL